MGNDKTTQNNTKRNKFKEGNKFGNRFSSDNQPTPEAKSKGWARKRIIDEYAEGIIEEAFGQVYDKLKSKELQSRELLEVFRSAIDMSGKKIQKQELEVSDNLQINVIKKED